MLKKDSCLVSYRVALVNPPVFKVVEAWNDTPNFGRVGLAYIAGYLRQYPGFEIMILDSKLERLNFEQSLDRILAFKPDIVGFGAFTTEVKPAAKLAQMVKEKLPDVITVIGSVHVTALPVKTLEEFPQFDFGVIGEGEVTFYELCDALRSKRPVTNVNGLSYRDGEKIEMTSPRERILDQNSIPFPAWDLLPHAESYIIMTLRGCPFNCVFCMNPNGRVARKRSIDNVIEELELVVEKYHPKEIMFGDELFSVDMDRTRELLNTMIEHKIHEKVGWWAQTHVHFVDYELLSLMKKANVIMIGLGIETGDEEKLKTLGKGTNMDMILKARIAAKKAKVPINSYFILGQPDETPESIKKTVDFAVKFNPELPIFGLMSPYPGTEVARLAALGEKGYRLVTTDWDEYNKQIGGALEFANLTRSQIERIQVMAYVKVFLYNYRYVDFIKFLWKYRTGAWSVFKKNLLDIIRRRKPVKEIHKSIVDKEGKELIASATTNWQKWQRTEMNRMGKANPSLLKVVHTDDKKQHL